VVAGVNDTLRPNFDPVQIAAAAAHTVGALRAADVAVLTMRLPDPGRMLGVAGVLARPLARRAHEINLVMDAVAERFGTLHFDAAGDPEAYSPSMWAADRLHPSERGHRLIARRFHALLAAAGHQVGAPPDAEPSNPPPSRRDELAWLATKGTAWVLRRSTDLVPSLLAMAFREWWCGPDADLAGPQDPVPTARSYPLSDVASRSSRKPSVPASPTEKTRVSPGSRPPACPARRAPRETSRSCCGVPTSTLADRRLPAGQGAGDDDRGRNGRVGPELRAPAAAVSAAGGAGPRRPRPADRGGVAGGRAGAPRWTRRGSAAGWPGDQ